MVPKRKRWLHLSLSLSLLFFFRRFLWRVAEGATPPASCRSVAQRRQPDLTFFSPQSAREGVATYYQSKCRELDVTIAQRENTLRRLEAQRNELNTRVRTLRDELQKLQEAGSYVGEMVKLMGKVRERYGEEDTLTLDV